METGVLPGDPRAALVHEGEGADVLVGNHGLGAVRGLLVSSVADGVASHASCHVVVVRQAPSATSATSATSGEIVVGLNGSPRTAQVLAFAFTEESLRSADLRRPRVEQA